MVAMADMAVVMEDIHMVRKFYLFFHRISKIYLLFIFIGGYGGYGGFRPYGKKILQK